MIHYASAAATRRTQRINYCRHNASRITIWNRDFTRHDHERGITFSFALYSLSVAVLHAHPFRTIALTIQIIVHSKNGFKRDWVINLKLVANCCPFTERAKRPTSKWNNQFCHFPQSICVVSPIKCNKRVGFNKTSQSTFWCLYPVCSRNINDVRLYGNHKIEFKELRSK